MMNFFNFYLLFNYSIAPFFEVIDYRVYVLNGNTKVDHLPITHAS